MLGEAQALVFGVGEGLEEKIRDVASEAVEDLVALAAGHHHPAFPQDGRCLEVVLWGRPRRWASLPRFLPPSKGPRLCANG